MMLVKPVTFLTTDDPEQTRLFYEETLGLEFVSDGSMALVFKTGGIMLRIQKVEKMSSVGHTVFGWEVGDIHEAVSTLSQKGLRFERYPHIEQDDSGVWKTPAGVLVAWFNDPSGNVLSLTQH